MKSILNISKTFKNISLLLSRIVLIVSAITLSLLMVFSLLFDSSMDFRTLEFSYSYNLFSASNVVGVLLLIIYFLLPIKIYIPNNNRFIHGVLSLLVIVSSLFIWCLIDPNKPGDSLDIYNSALNWYRTGSPENGYIDLYPYQFGLIYLVYILITIFKSEILVTGFFRFLNLLSLLVIANILLCFAKKLASYQYASMRLFVLLFCAFFVPFMLVTFMYGDLIGFAFGLISVWCYQRYSELRENRFWLFVSAIFLVGGMYFRLNTSIIGLAIAIHAVIYEPSIKNKIFTSCLFVVAIILGINLGKMILLLLFNVRTHEVPAIARLAMGLDAYGAGLREPGWYNSYYMNLVAKYGHNLNAISNQARIDLLDSFKHFISDPSYFFYFMGRKFASMTTLSDFEGFTVNFISYENTYRFLWFTIPGSYFIYWFNQISRISFLFISIGSLCAVVNRKFKLSKLDILFLLIICGGFSYHMLFEAKARYLIPYVLLLIPIASQVYPLMKSYVSEKLKFTTIIRNRLSLFLFFGSILLAILNFFYSKLPVLYFEGYTDTLQKTYLNLGTYYQYPIHFEKDVELTDVSILTFNEENSTKNCYIQLDLLDLNMEILSSQVIEAFRIQDQSWTTFDINLHIDAGSYFIQVSTNNETEMEFGILTGEQYSYVNEENMMLNGFEQNMKGNIKIYVNH